MKIKQGTRTWKEVVQKSTKQTWHLVLVHILSEKNHTIQHVTTTSENSDRKRKRGSNAYGSETPRRMGPSGGGETEDTRKENGDASVEFGATGKEAASSSGATITNLTATANLTAQRNATNEPSQLSNVLYPDPFTIELQRIKQQEVELDMHRVTMRITLKKKMEEEIGILKRSLEEKVKQEEIKFHQEQLHIRDLYEQVLLKTVWAKELLAKNESLVDELSAKSIQQSHHIASASCSGSSQGNNTSANSNGTSSHCHGTESGVCMMVDIE